MKDLEKEIKELIDKYGRRVETLKNSKDLSDKEIENNKLSAVLWQIVINDLKNILERKP